MEYEQKIEVEYESNETDFQRVLLWYHWRRIVLNFGLTLIAGIVLYHFIGSRVPDIKDNGWAAFAFIATVSTLVALDIYRLCFYQAKKLKEITKPSKTIFTEQGIESKTPTTSSKRDWESYAKIYETTKDFIFLQQENAFATIPKRFFKNQDEIEMLKNLISRKLGANAKLQK